MSKFNTVTTRPATGRGPIRAEATPSGVTYEGGDGYARDAKSELFLLAVSNMVGERTFYESADDRDARYESLIAQVAVADPGWTARFLRWLRDGANMRSASLVGGLEAARAMVAAGIPGSRQIVASVLLRADEPGEALAYWTSRYGRRIPMAVKNGIADAARKLYNEYALLKYDTDSKGFRFADVLELVHPAPTAPWQDDLYQYALARRHNRDGALPAELGMIRRNAGLRARVAAGEAGLLLDAENLKAAGMTWEDVLSLAGDKLPKARLWEAIIPSMGLMALARNLRNFDEAGVSDEVAAMVAARFSDPEQIARSRMFPFRWLSAYEAAPSLRWGHALDKALQASLSNLPALPGRTLVLVDTSGSMTQTSFSARSKVTPLKAAAVFGVALAAKGENVDLVGFANGTRTFRHNVPKGASVIREVAAFVARSGEDGHGTAIAESLRRNYKGHDRVVIVSDMQTMADRLAGDWQRPGAGVTDLVPDNIPLYGFNLGGYKLTAFPAGTRNRHEFGGLTDQTFRQIPLLEAGNNGDWPF